MSALEILTEPGLQRASLTLVHFLWQGAIVGLALHCTLLALRQARPEVRYAASVAALVVLGLCPLITFWAEPHRADVGPSPSAARDRQTADRAIFVKLADRGSEAPGPIAIENRGRVSTETHEVLGRPWLLEAQPWILGVWCGGVLLLSGWLGLGEKRLRQLRRESDEVPRPALAMARCLARKLRMNAVPKVLASTRVVQPLAMGLLRPTILIPASWLSGMPPEGIEAILAHELAHIRRWDLWVNLLQRILEILGFYHPVVWWASGHVRMERELCCDGLAVRATGKSLAYATALEFAARATVVGRRPLLSAALGGESMSLLYRIESVLGHRTSPASSRWWAVLLLPVGAVLSASVLATQVERGDEDPKPRSTLEARVTAESPPPFQDGEPAREREVRREGDREPPAREVRREGDREPPAREIRREGDREPPAREIRREGDREPPAREVRREGDREPPAREVRREGDREPPAREVRREGDRERTRVLDTSQDDFERLIRAAQTLQRQVQTLRREVDQLRRENDRLRAELRERGDREAPRERGGEPDVGREREREGGRPVQREREGSERE